MFKTKVNDDFKFLKENYDKLSVKEISHYYGLSINRIYHKASEFNLSHKEYNRKFMSEKSRRYNLNENYFEKIDTEDKAYFLGLLYADGYNQVSVHSVSIQLHKKDSEILEKFRGFTNSNSPLFKTKTDNCFRLTFNNLKMSNDLEKLGCIQKKSKRIRVPKIQMNLLNHFLRGYFDGDGSVFVYRTKIINKRKDKIYYGLRFGLNFTGNSKFIKDIYYILTKQIKSNNAISLVKENRCENVSMVNVSGTSVIKILRFLYKDSSVYMKRKYEKFMLIRRLADSGLKGKRLVDFMENSP